MRDLAHRVIGEAARLARRSETGRTEAHPQHTEREEIRIEAFVPRADQRRNGVQKSRHGVIAHVATQFDGLATAQVARERGAGQRTVGAAGRSGSSASDAAAQEPFSKEHFFAFDEGASLRPGRAQCFNDGHQIIQRPERILCAARRPR